MSCARRERHVCGAACDDRRGHGGERTQRRGWARGSNNRKIALLKRGRSLVLGTTASPKEDARDAKRVLEIKTSGTGRNEAACFDNKSDGTNAPARFQSKPDCSKRAGLL